MLPTERLEKRAYVAQVLSELLRLMGQGEVPLEFQEWEDGQLAIALHIASADSPLKANAGQKRSPSLNALQFLLNRLLKRNGEGAQTPACSKVFLDINGFPERHSPPRPPPEASERVPSEAASFEKEEQFSMLATGLAQKCILHGRIYAVLFLNRHQHACMKQATSQLQGLRAFSEGEAHWSRLVFEPGKPMPMPQKSRIALNNEGLAHKSPKVLTRGRPVPL